MNKTDYKRPLTVGVFIFAGLVIIILCVFTIGSQQKLFQKKITLNVIFDDVGGLQPGNNVWLSGVKIGTVKKIVFYKSTQVAITTSIESVAQSHICKDAKAKISTDGFIGNKIVVIYGGTEQAGMVASGDFLQSEKGTSTDDMLATLQISNTNLLEITQNFKLITRKMLHGDGTVSKLINDGSLVNQLQQTILNLRNAAATSEKMMTNAAQFTARLNNGNGLVNELITDTAVFISLKETMNQLKSAVSNATMLVDNMQKAGAGLNKTNTPAGMLLNDDEVAGDLKAMIRNLKSGSQKLDEDLEALQHNFLLRGYFRKKAKSKSN